MITMKRNKSIKTQFTIPLKKSQLKILDTFLCYITGNFTSPESYL